jgi:alkyl hydroperoxide reductase subunit AhpC
MKTALPLVLLTAASAIAPAQNLPAIHHAAPEFTGKAWLNTPNQTALRLEDRKGKVTIVHFWTYACINCRRNLPIYDRWFAAYRARGVEVIGIHTPELPEEREWSNVAAQTKKLGIAYPVLFDPGYRN